MNFDKLGLSEAILLVLESEGYSQPTPIQSKAIPLILEGKDIVATAQTGTGKTAAFTLPLLENLLNGPKVKPKETRALVLAPTRELAIQVAKSISTYSQNLKLTSTVVYGGIKIESQKLSLEEGVDILVATPGRLLDLYGKRAIKFHNLEAVIFDEADRMLDMGFIDDINEILSHLPNQKQSMMFSATFPKEVRKLAKTIVNNPVEISVAPEVTTASTVEQWVYTVDAKRKEELLCKLITEGEWNSVLVFTRTRDGADQLAKYLIDEGIKAAAIHSNKPQSSRIKTLARFKEGVLHVMVATDIAARGIDIELLPYVINFDLPTRAEDYVHRIGRTGRAGSVGEAISFVSGNDFKQLAAIERLIAKILTRKVIEGFEPKHLLPKSKLPRAVRENLKSENKVKTKQKLDNPVKSKPNKKTKKKVVSKNDSYKKSAKTTGRKKKSRRP